MTHTITNLSAVSAATKQLARLGAAHGYRIDGDTARVNAMFTVLDSAAHDRAWALELWACPAAPANAGAIAGRRVARAPLPPMGEIADDTHAFEASAFACPPAGGASYHMVIALVAGQSREAGDVQDFFVYPRQERFVQPRLGGTSGYRVAGDRVEIAVERVENPREAGTASGSLSLELWALPAPHDGGEFDGAALAGVALAPVSGQSALENWTFDAAFTAPPPGRWNLTLMLREWTAAGYVTRDYVNFTHPYFQASAPAAAERVEGTPVKPAAASSALAVPAPVVTAPVVTAPVVTAPIEVAPAAPAQPRPPVAKVQAVVAKVETVASASAPAPSAPAAAPSPVKTVVTPEAKTAAKPAASKKPASKKPAPAEPISVNTASATELAGVEGLPAKAAEAIIKQRPFRSVDELARIKGIGASLLAKIRSRLKL
jgi:competence ComEA-like helix-hairpin-helix protein